MDDNKIRRNQNLFIFSSSREISRSNTMFEAILDVRNNSYMKVQRNDVVNKQTSVFTLLLKQKVNKTSKNLLS